MGQGNKMVLPDSTGQKEKVDKLLLPPKISILIRSGLLLSIYAIYYWSFTTGLYSYRKALVQITKY
jgi:hypothetical protein